MNFYHWVAHVRGHALRADNERMLKPGDSFWECVKTEERYSRYCPEMVVLPAGKFMMGSPETEKDREKDEGPLHEVTIARPFAVSKYAVTFDQWDACVAYGGCAEPQAGRSKWGRGRQPAIYVNWEDAQQYVRWLSGLTGQRQRYRLISEAEWEYAARAGSTTAYSFGEDPAMLGDYAWYGGNSKQQAHPVGEKKPNAFGLYDMHGNVWQWVEDCYHQDYKGAPEKGLAWIQADDCFHMVRGGSWEDGPSVLRSAFRGELGRIHSFPDGGGDVRYRTLGFRVGRTLTP
jgi:formylglycine-generating enzyme required for sulfatase activity